MIERVGREGEGYRLIRDEVACTSSSVAKLVTLYMNLGGPDNSIWRYIENTENINHFIKLVSLN